MRSLLPSTLFRDGRGTVAELDSITNLLGWDTPYVGTMLQVLNTSGMPVRRGVKSGMTVCLVEVLGRAVGCYNKKKLCA